MKRLLRFSIVVGFSGVLQASPSLAISLDLVPDSPTVVAGDSLNVAIVISGLVAGAGSSHSDIRRPAAA